MSTWLRLLCIGVAAFIAYNGCRLFLFATFTASPVPAWWVGLFDNSVSALLWWSSAIYLTSSSAIAGVVGYALHRFVGKHGMILAFIVGFAGFVVSVATARSLTTPRVLLMQGVLLNFFAALALPLVVAVATNVVPKKSHDPAVR